MPLDGAFLPDGVAATGETPPLDGAFLPGATLSPDGAFPPDGGLPLEGSGSLASGYVPVMDPSVTDPALWPAPGSGMPGTPGMPNIPGVQAQGPFDPVPAVPGSQPVPPWGPGPAPLLPGPAGYPGAETGPGLGDPALGPMGSAPYQPGTLPYGGPYPPWAAPMQPRPSKTPKLSRDLLPSTMPDGDPLNPLNPDGGDGAGGGPGSDEDDWLDDIGPDPLIQLPSKLQSVVVEIAMVGLVLAIIAFAAAWLPDFSMLATIVAAISMPFGVVALIGTLKKGSRGRWMSIASLALAVLAIVVAIFTQTFAAPEEDVASQVAAERASTASPASSSSSSAAGAAGDRASSSSSSSSSQAQITAYSSNAPHVASSQGVIVEDANAGAASTEDWAVGNNLTDLPIGTPAEYAPDLAVSVDTVTPGLINYDGTAITCVTVVYTNLGSVSQPYHQYDWKAKSSSGNEVSPCYFTSAQSELKSDEIAPGTTVSGNIYFQGKLSRVIFTPTGSDTTTHEVSWLVK